MRPEHVAMSQAGGAAGWSLKVEALEMLGAERLVYGRLGDGLFTARIDATLTPPKVGDTVTLQLTPEHMHWFDAATNKRL